VAATEMISLDVLALVRFGLRAPDDPRILDTLAAMPLVWAHAEFLKLCHSWAEGVVDDRPGAVWERWHGVPPVTRRRVWRLATPIPTIPTGRTLRIELLRPGLVHYSVDDWATTHDLNGRDTGIGLWVVDILANGAAGGVIAFTIRWTDDSSWEHQNFAVLINPDAAPHS
jgi:glucoamylase